MEDNMKRILLPLEETDRSLKALHYITTNYSICHNAFATFC